VPAGLSEWHIAELIEDHEVDAGKIVCDAPLSAGARLGLEPIDEVDSDQEAAVRSRPDAASTTAIVSLPAAEPVTATRRHLERSEVRLNRRDSRIRRVLIQPAGWMEASRNGWTLFSGFAGAGD
jgi:hypothetical protein